MSDPTRTRVDDLFDAALERAPEERVAFLRAQLGDQPEILRDVEELLAAHELADGFLEVPATRQTLEAESPARRIGVYRVVRELGRGGMGVVYLAERDDGEFRRRVAVKLLRNSPDADELRRRFLAERQILASLDHPNIAQLIDGGVTDGKLPYLVMEYVEGLPITEYCDRHRLTVAERLRLFQEVCAAVHHAHRNLVIHRDLKPGNILVTQSGQVKLLDFGIAKLLNPGLAAIDQPVTWTSQRVLTPEYASPEQLRGEPLSTTSDIYALGVVLYELTAGRRPHELRDGSTEALATRVWQEEPSKPSTACAWQDLEPRPAATKAAAIAAARDTTPPQLQRALRGDVDAIILMALRKEPGRRYGSAELLAQDVQQYLDGQPVLAHKGSRSYYVGKFVRRHRIPVIAGALVVLSLITGAGVAMRQTATARNERDRSQQALREAEEITGFLVSMFEANDPDQSRGQETTARDLLRRGMQRVEQLHDQPLLQARLLEVIGLVYHSMSEYAQGHAVLSRALGIREAQLGVNHPDVAQTLLHLSQSLRFLSAFSDGEKAAERALDIRLRVLGPKHPDVASALLQVATMAVYVSDVPRSIALTRQALSIREAAFGVNDTSVATALLFLGGRLSRLGEYEEAERHLQRGIAIQRSIGPEHSQLADAILGLAYLLDELPGRTAEAEALYREGLRIRRRTLGVDHQLSNSALGDLVWFLTMRQRYQEALPLAREHFELTQRLYGAGDVRMAGVMITYGRVLAGVGRRREAIELARTSLALNERAYGKEHAFYANDLSALAMLLADDGKSAEAEPLLRETISFRERASGRESANVAVSYTDLATVQIKGGRYADAEESVSSALRIWQRMSVRPVHREYQHTLRVAMQVYERLGKNDQAQRYRQLIVTE